MHSEKIYKSFKSDLKLTDKTRIISNLPGLGLTNPALRIVSLNPSKYARSVLRKENIKKKKTFCISTG